MATPFSLHLSSIQSSSSSSFLSLYRSLNFHSSFRTSYKPIKIYMSLENELYWTSINFKIKAHLQKTLPVCPPLSLLEPMNHLVFAAPNSLAPALCIASCELVGGQRDQAIAAASAMHLMHAAIYTHNKLQLSDQSKPKNIHETQHLFQRDIELLCCTGMLGLGFELLAESDDPVENVYSLERISRMMAEMSRAVGSEGMCGGEYLLHQYCSSTGSCENDQGWIKHACEKKEGSLFACGAACGAILGGGSEKEIEKLRKFGLYLGTMHGLTNEVLIGRENKDEKRLKEIVEDLRGLAFKELEGFKEENVKGISKLVNAKMFCQNMDDTNSLSL